MGNKARNKIHQVAWKFKTQNLVVTYTLILRKNLEYLLKSILSILYVISKLGKFKKRNDKKKIKNLGSNSFMVYGTLEKECLKYLENKYISYSHY